MLEIRTLGHGDESPGRSQHKIATSISKCRRAGKARAAANRYNDASGDTIESLMFQAASLKSTDKAGQYRELAEQARGLLHGERDRIANAANFAALVYNALPDLNWAGFYFFDGSELVVGPFQGQPACVRIALGKGVCGTAAATRQTQLVRDVDAFPGHIACDSASRSEIVIPLVDGERLIGVWDVDSPKLARFDAADRDGMEQLAGIFMDSLRAA
jgi:L-methionine (R)-S-oxide reductase